MLPKRKTHANSVRLPPAARLALYCVVLVDNIDGNALDYSATVRYCLGLNLYKWLKVACW